jgi:hypothetical protein
MYQGGRYFGERLGEETLRVGISAPYGLKRLVGLVVVTSVELAHALDETFVNQ